MNNESILNFDFSKGINEYKDETLLDISEASKSQNIDIDSGVLSTIKEPSVIESRSGIIRMAKYCNNDDVTLMPLTTNSDYLNYQTGEDEVMLTGDGVNPVKVYNGSSYRNLKNRRITDITSLNIPKELAAIWSTPQSLLGAFVRGGSKENSIKVRINPSNAGNAIYFKRASTSNSYSKGDSVPYDAIPYTSENDILETYVGEYITFFEKGTWDGGTRYDKPVIIVSVQVPITKAMITSKVITPTTFSEDVPKGSMLELNHERVWMAGDVDFPNRVYFSKDLDIDDWTIPTDEGEANQHGGLIDVPTWDGGKIIGLKVLFGDMFVFKDKNIFRIFGTYPGNYQLEQVCTITGAISDRSIVSGSAAVYFAAKDGIYAFNGNSAKLISQKIKNTWKTLNKNYLKNAVGIFYDNNYFLAVPEGESLVNNLLIKYNTETETFTFIRGLSIKDFIEFEGNMYFCNASGIYNMFQLDTISTSSYQANWTSGKMNFGASNAIKRTQMMYFLGSGDGKVEISVENEKGKKKTVQILLSTDEKIYRKRIKKKGRTLKISISSVDGSKFKIKNLQATYEIDYD